jgi:hypothetical protein
MIDLVSNRGLHGGNQANNSLSFWPGQKMKRGGNKSERKYYGKIFGFSSFDPRKIESANEDNT